MYFEPIYRTRKCSFSTKTCCQAYRHVCFVNDKNVTYTYMKTEDPSVDKINVGCI